MGRFSLKSTQNQNLFKENPKNSMEKMQKLKLRVHKFNFPGTHWRGLAVIGAQKKPLHLNWEIFEIPFSLGEKS